MTDDQKVWRSGNGEIELRLGAWSEALTDVERADSMLTDPPFSARTHKGQRTGSEDESTLDYVALMRPDAISIAYGWASRLAKWSVVFTDHVAFSWHEKAWQDQGWNTFAPVGWVKPDPTPRKVADGPTCSIEQIMIARPQGWPTERGSRPGHYLSPCSSLRGSGIAGGKPLQLMRALVRDYTAKGDLIVDPYAGSGTTLLAAAMEGRRAIGCEVDEKTFELAVRRLSLGYTLPLFETA